MQSQGIVLEREQRRRRIWEAACMQAQAVGGTIPDSSKENLLDEVADLVETPTVLRGSFQASFLDLPE